MVSPCVGVLRRGIRVELVVGIVAAGVQLAMPKSGSVVAPYGIIVIPQEGVIFIRADVCVLPTFSVRRVEPIVIEHPEGFSVG